ncbi:hypothetical protein LguiA_008431 [Lonicera macranthoides]
MLENHDYQVGHFQNQRKEYNSAWAAHYLSCGGWHQNWGTKLDQILAVVDSLGWRVEDQRRHW